MVEVDPKLFVKCRLCLDVEGQLLIVPSVQQQIKYCFDIDVETFDGLPQLICKKCENFLRKYCSRKKLFIDKQKTLRDTLQGNPKQIKEVASSQKKNRKRIARLSSSSDDSLCNSAHGPEPLDTYNNCIEESKCTANNLNKYFICRICGDRYQSEQNVKNHLKEHNDLVSKYNIFFNKSCLVAIEKFDSETNITNSNNAVVYDSDKIILNNTYNPYYYCIFDLKDTHMNVKRTETYDVQSNSEIALLSKRQRLLSRCSSETVVIEEKINNSNESHEACTRNEKISPTVVDYIDIDSSDSSISTTSDEKRKSAKENKSPVVMRKIEETLDYKTIHTIVRTCHDIYLKQQNSDKRKRIEESRRTDLDLQHKILSMGRKIITKKNFNCTGLLRYLESKNLNVAWKELNQLNVNKNGKYIRICTKIKSYDDAESENLGWKCINEFVNEDEIQEVINLLVQLKRSNFNSDNTAKEEEIINQLVPNLPHNGTVRSHTDIDLSKKLESENKLKKPLNKNTVPNFKLLPKGFNITKVPNDAINNTTVPDANQGNENTEILSHNMPTIVSSRSLALDLPDINGSTAPEATNCEVSVVNTVVIKDNEYLAPVADRTADPIIATLPNQPPTSYPRIKVKPVSELMPQNVSCNTNNTPNYILKSNEPAYMTCDNVRKDDIIGNNNQLANIVIVQNIKLNPVQICEPNNATHSNELDCILLDTVEFPNTKTHSPFQYFKNLLLVHNIILLDSDKPVPRDAECLVSLQLGFQQEKCVPVNLRLALFGSKNTFCIKIKDSKQTDVNINMFSAIWQWELLKIYNANVINRVLLTAHRVSSETFHYTQNFFRLLKSIHLKKEVLDHGNRS